MSGEGKPPAASRSRSSALPRLYRGQMHQDPAALSGFGQRAEESMHQSFKVQREALAAELLESVRNGTLGAFESSPFLPAAPPTIPLRCKTRTPASRRFRLFPSISRSP